MKSEKMNLGSEKGEEDGGNRKEGKRKKKTR
jgi:hypothetical protein